jgi:sigma-B regulation protein RsbU (phosphoserine phosphatase)
VPVAAAACVTDAHHFRMGCGIARLHSLIVATGDNLPSFAHQHRADGNPPFPPGFLGLFDGCVEIWLMRATIAHVGSPCIESAIVLKLERDCRMASQKLASTGVGTGVGTDNDVQPEHIGMRTIDISGNRRIAILMETMGAVSRATDPDQVVDLFSHGMIQLNGRRGLMAINTRDLALGQYRITRMVHEDGHEVINSKTAWSNGDDAPVREGGFFGQLIRTAYPELIHHFHLRDDPIIGDILARYGSMMAIPIFDEGEPMNWAIFLHTENDGFGPDDLESAILRSNVIGRAARQVQIARDLRKANQRINDEVTQIATIQRTLLPATLPKIPGLQMAVSYEVFDQAGGDMYDFVPIGRCRETGVVDEDTAWLILIADASGHGPAAAVVTAMVHAILHAYPSQPCGSAELLKHVNTHLSAKRIESSFVTAFLAIYDPSQRTLTYSRAGHDPPLLKTRGSAIQRLDQIGGIPLGILPDVDYEEATITLQSGQTLVLYTDGITEARSPKGEMFSITGMEKALTTCTGEADCTVETITRSLLQHEGGVRPTDDQTLLAIEVI